jgi:transcriptional regulator
VWTPPYNRVPDEQLRPMVSAIGSADLVTIAADGFPVASRLPVVWNEGRLLFHMAVANPQWRDLEDGSPALAVVTGSEAYVTPTWYAGTYTHGREVPTWNYSAIHFRGRVEVYRDDERLRASVSELTDLQEAGRVSTWAVSDAPRSFIDQQLRAIVGVDLLIESVSARAKRSQNRTLEDRASVIRGLRSEGGPREQQMAEQMAADLDGA